MDKDKYKDDILEKYEEYDKKIQLDLTYIDDYYTHIRKLIIKNPENYRLMIDKYLKDVRTEKNKLMSDL